MIVSVPLFACWPLSQPMQTNAVTQSKQIKLALNILFSTKRSLKANQLSFFDHTIKADVKPL
jgi:hypothetical protein